MQLRQISRIILGVISILGWQYAGALGLGEATVKSAYNEPLIAEIRLLQTQELSSQEILVALASSEDFSRIGIDREFFLTNLTFTVVLDNPNNPYIRVTSVKPVQEPYLNFLVDTRWPSGRLLREYTLLLDLPVFADEQPVAVVNPVASPVVSSEVNTEAPPVAVAPAPQIAEPQVSAPSPQPEEPARLAETVPAEPVNDTSNTRPSLVPAPIFSTPEESANDFLRKLSQQAANRESSFKEAPKASSESSRSSSAEPSSIAQPTAPERVETRIVTTTTNKPPSSTTTQQPAAVSDSAPAKVLREEVSQTPSESEYEIKDGDTLWRIATRLRPNSSVSVQQTMLAIQASNPDAFIDDNINLLRKGRVLRAPTLSEVQETDFRKAVAAVKQQNQAWSKRATPAVAVIPDAQKPTLSAVTPTLDNKTASQQPEGRLRIASASNSESGNSIKGTGASGTGDSLENDLAITEEQLDKANRENSNLKTRISELEEQIKTLEGLVELTSNQLKALEVTSAQDKQVSENDAETTEAPEQQAEISDGPADDQVGQVAQDKVDGQANSGSDKTVVADDVRSSEQGIIDRIIAFFTQYLTIIAGFILALLLAIWLIARRNKHKEEDIEDDFTLSELSDSDDDFDLDAVLADDTVTDDLDDLDTLDALDDLGEQNNDLERSQSVEAKTDDAITESDIYVSLGQTDKAEELLQQEIQQNPDNAEARLALLKIYANTQNAEAFDDQYAQLLPLGDSQVNDQAKVLRDGIDGIGGFDVDSYSVNEFVDGDSAGFLETDNLVGEVEELDLDEDLNDNDDDSDFLASDEELGLDSFDASSESKTEWVTDSAADDTESDTLDIEDIDLDVDDIELDIDDLELNLDDDDLDSISLDNDDAVDSQEDIAFELTEDDDGLNDLDFNEIDLVENDDVDKDEELQLEIDDDLLSELTEDADDIDLLSADEQNAEEVTLDSDLAEDLDNLSDTDADLGQESGLSDSITDASLDLSLSELDSEDDLDLELVDFELDDDTELTLDSENLDGDSEGLEEIDQINEEPDLTLDDLEEKLDANPTDNDLDGLVNETTETTGSADEDSDQSILESDDLLEIELDDDSFDLDLPPKDIDINSLDKEIEDMTAMLDDEMDSDSNLGDIETNVDLDTDVDLDSSIEAPDENQEDDIDLLEMDFDIEESIDSETNGLDSLALDIADTEQSDIENHSNEDVNSSDVNDVELVAEKADDVPLVITSDDDVEAADDAELSEDDLAFLGDADEVETKLDLARAYMDMGDNEGANDILEEVLEEGTQDQQQAAQKLLNEL